MSTIRSKGENPVGKKNTQKFENVESALDRLEAENKVLREQNDDLIKGFSDIKELYEQSKDKYEKLEKLFIIDEEVEDNEISTSEIKNILLHSLPNNISVDIVWELSNELRAKINAEIFDSENSLALNKLALSKLK